MKIENTRRFHHVVYLRKQQGASLLEGIAYLGIAALVVLGAVSLLTGASASAKANQTSSELVALRTAVKKLYAGQAYPTGSLTGFLTTAKAVPSTLQVSGTSITNSFGGAVTVEGTSSATFTVTYNNVPQDVCVSVLSGMTGWRSVRQGNGSLEESFPLTAADATAVCTSTTSNNVSFVGT
jgi:hypothetical protein